MNHNYENLKSINQTHEKNTLSNKYKFIPTTKVIDMIKSKGWYVSSASEGRTNKETNQGFQKHMVRFQHPELSRLGKMEVGELRPEMVLYNSHDGASSFKFMLGIYRCICSNQMTVSDSQLAAMRVRHMGFKPAEVFKAIEGVVTNVPQLTSKVEKFGAIQLTNSEKQLFAESATTLRFDNVDFLNQEYKRDYASKLLGIRRYGDNGDDLWKVFNRIQENLLNGGIRRVKGLDDYGRVKQGKTRAIKSVSQNIKLNQALWTLTEKMAEFKS